MMALTDPKRVRLFKVLTPVLSIVFTLILLEVGLRATDHFSKKTTKKEKRIEIIQEAGKLYPASDKLFSLTLECENLGHRNYPSMGTSLRDYDYPLPKPENTYRIVGLGDSFAWGWGVADNRRTTFKYLECWLNAGEDGRQYEVINGAQPGKSVKDYENYVHEYGHRFDPDMFLILYNINDAYLPHASMVVDKRTMDLMQKQSDPLSDISKLYRFIKKMIVKKRVHDYTIKHIKEGYFGPEKQQKWGKAKGNLRVIQAYCQERGIELIVAIFPLLFELEKKYPFQEEVDEVESFLKSNRIKTVNLLPTFKGKKSTVLWCSPTDSHPNRVAHRLAAESIYRFLQEQFFTES
jgi:hypothetical protein